MSIRQATILLVFCIVVSGVALWAVDAIGGPLSDAQKQAVGMATIGILGAGLGWHQYRKTVPLRLMLLPMGTLMAVLLGIAALVLFGNGLSAFLPVLLPLAIGLGVGTAWWIERRAKAAGYNPNQPNNHD